MGRVLDEDLSVVYLSVTVHSCKELFTLTELKREHENEIIRFFCTSKILTHDVNFLALRC